MRFQCLSKYYFLGRRLFIWEIFYKMRKNNPKQYILYLDESGSSDKHDIPLKNGQTSCFTIAGFVLLASRWKTFNRQYLKLKTQYFKKEIDKL